MDKLPEWLAKGVVDKIIFQPAEQIIIQMAVINALFPPKPHNFIKAVLGAVNPNVTQQLVHI